jgi:hypothetical protein
MDFLKFFKKHYEKVLLSVVLAVLAIATIFLLMRVSEERAALDEVTSMDPARGSRPLGTMDLSTNEMVLGRLRRPEPVELIDAHNLFNPVPWKRLADGNLIKLATGNEIGAGALEIVRTSPLMLRVSYEGPVVRETQTSHRFRVTREAHREPRKRAPTPAEVTRVGESHQVLVLREMRPSVAEPNEFVLEMIDERRTITVSADAPFEDVDGYMVDLRYPPEKQVFPNKRVGDRLVFAGDTHTIVAIEADSVTVEASSNGKRTTIRKSDSAGATSP